MTAGSEGWSAGGPRPSAPPAEELTGESGAELGPAVGPDAARYASSGKHMAQAAQQVSGACLSRDPGHERPAREAVNVDQERAARPCKIVRGYCLEHSRGRLLCHQGLFLLTGQMQLAFFAGADEVCDILVHPGPVHRLSCPPLGPFHPLVAGVESLQREAAEARRYHQPPAAHHQTVIHRQAISEAPVRTEQRVQLSPVIWEAGQDGVFERQHLRVLVGGRADVRQCDVTERAGVTVWNVADEGGDHAGDLMADILLGGLVFRRWVLYRRPRQRVGYGVQLPLSPGGNEVEGGQVLTKTLETRVFDVRETLRVEDRDQRPVVRHHLELLHTTEVYGALPTCPHQGEQLQLDHGVARLRLRQEP